jgi:uncharacterized protein DUF4238
MSGPIRHHTVPAAYLSGFLGDGESMLHVYTRDGKYFRGAPDKVGTRRRYYAVRKADDSFDNTIETTLANDVETHGISALRRLANGYQISRAARARLCVYMALQYLRTPYMRAAIENTYGELLDHVARRAMKEPGYFADFLIKSRNLEPSKAANLAKDSIEAYLDGRIAISVKPEFSLQKMFMHCKTYAEQMHLCKWEVITSKKPTFITSDLPVHFQDKDHVVLADPELVIQFPLTSRSLLVLRATEPEDQRWQRLRSMIPDAYLPGFVVWDEFVPHRDVLEGESERLNAITASMCEQCVYSPFASDEFQEILSRPSQSPRMSVSAAGDYLRMSFAPSRD